VADGDELLVDIARQPDETIRLWPDGPPGGVPDGLEQHYVSRDDAYGLADRALYEIIDPAMAVFKPEHPDGSALLLIPGGATISSSSRRKVTKAPVGSRGAVRQSMSSPIACRIRAGPPGQTRHFGMPSAPCASSVRGHGKQALTRPV
jgi:hypothetical protein